MGLKRRFNLNNLRAFTCILEESYYVSEMHDLRILFMVKKLVLLQRPSRSRDLNQIKRAFKLLKIKRKAEEPANKQRLKTDAVKEWQRITKDGAHSLRGMNIQPI